MNRSPYASNLSAPTPLTCENCSPETGLIRTMSRFIGKDDIRGFTEFAGDVKPQRTQFGEQFLVSVARHIRSHSREPADGDSARFAACFRSIFLIS